MLADRSAISIANSETGQPKVMCRMAENTWRNLRRHQEHRRLPSIWWAFRPCLQPAGGSILKVQKWLLASERR